VRGARGHVSARLTYIADELVKEDRRRGPEVWPFLLRRWESTWVKYWLAEFFCDLFAVYPVGPAFAWAHLHLAAKRGGNPYEVPMATLSSHPANDARMRAMLYALSQANFADQAAVIGERWRRLLAQSGERPEPEYHRCYPEEIMRRIVALAHDGVIAIGCRIATPDTQDDVYTILNQAWDQFWQDPAAYVRWEEKTVDRLFNTSAVPRHLNPFEVQPHRNFT
jgi:hypothetical protein